MKRFNTSGPNIPAMHYTLERAGLIAKGADLVKNDRYFTILAPRQTGKSTYFRLLLLELEAKGYQVIHLNVENYKAATVQGLLSDIADKLTKLGLEPPAFNTFDDLSRYISKTNDRRLVLIIDEIEGLNPDLFGQFLHTIRNLYHFRESHCLKSTILVGVSNIVGVVSDNASPFNIADNLPVPYFTHDEVRELLAQHTTATGQRFEARVVDKIYEVTAGQPGLVKGKKSPQRIGFDLQFRDFSGGLCLRSRGSNLPRSRHGAGQERPDCLSPRPRIPVRDQKILLARQVCAGQKTTGPLYAQPRLKQSRLFGLHAPAY